MFGRRPDGTQVRELSAMRRFMPFVSPRRNDSVFHLAQDIDVEAALEFLEKKNRERPPDRPITLFHLFLRSGSQALYLRPGVNRFVKGGKLWQRHGEWITFSAKVRIEDGAPLVTIKRRFEPTRETLDEMVDAIYGADPPRARRQAIDERQGDGSAAAAAGLRDPRRARPVPLRRPLRGGAARDDRLGSALSRRASSRTSAPSATRPASTICGSTAPARSSA